MTDTQFQLLDELYFVTSYSALANATGLNNEDLENELAELWKNGWLRIYFPNSETELPLQTEVALPDFRECYFLASKAGLLAHNSL